MDSILIKERLIDSVVADTSVELFGEKFDSPVLMPAFSHLRQYEGRALTGLEEYSVAAKNMNILNFVGMMENDMFKRIVDTGAKTVRIVKPYSDNEKVRDQMKFAEDVGAFGIDGCMSSFLGQSVVVDQLCFLFIGDLSFFYDMNSLGIRHIKNNVRIILINNNGGMEFKYGSSSEKKKAIDRYIAAAGHFKNAEGWSKTNGFDYYSVKDPSSFNEIKNRLVAESSRPIVVEVFVSDADENQAYTLLRKREDNRPFIRKFIERVKNDLKI